MWYENDVKHSEGQYSDDKKNGKWSHWYENKSLKTETIYLDDQIINEIKWDDNGNLVYKKGDEVVENFYRSGNLKSKINFKNGKRNGLYIEYYENGKVRSKGEMISDTMNGDWKFFYHNGKKEMEGKFVFGQMSSVRIYHDNGVLKEVVNG